MTEDIERLIELRREVIANWTPEIIGDNINNAHQHHGISTMGSQGNKFAAVYMDKFFAPIAAANGPLRVLEVGSGNCIASKIVYDKLKDIVSSWTCTDVIDYNHDNGMTFHQLHAVDAVAQYGATADILVLICPAPPAFERPNGGIEVFSDYWSCEDFIEQTTSPRYIVFVGEMGAMDGTPGIDEYLYGHPRLTSVTHATVSVVENWLGRRCREITIFKISEKNQEIHQEIYQSV